MIRFCILTHALAMLALLTLNQSCTTPSILATQSIQKGDAANNTSNYPQAIAHYEEYLRISPQLGVYRNMAMEAGVCRKLAQAYSTQGKYGNAKSYLGMAIKADSALADNKVQLIEDYQLLGLVHGYAGEIHASLAALQKCLALAEGMEKSSKNFKRASFASANLAIAQVHLSLGNYRESEDYARKAYHVFSGLADQDAGLVESELVLGIISREKGELVDASSRILRSQKLAMKDNTNTGRQYQALSEVEMLKGNIEEAIRFKVLALEEAEKSKIPPQIIIAMTRLGDAYAQLGDDKKANDHYQQALKIQGTMTDVAGSVNMPSLHTSTANTLDAYNYYDRSGSSLGKGLVLMKMGQTLSDQKPDTAMVLFTSARNEFLKADSKEGVAKSNLEIVRLDNRFHRKENVVSLLQEADEMSSQPDLKWQIKFESGIYHESVSDFSKARSAYEESIRIIEGMRGNISNDELKTLFANSKNEVYQRLILLLLRHSQRWNDLNQNQAIVKAFDYNEQARSRTFLDLLGNKKIEPRQSADTVDLKQEQLYRLKIQQLIRETNKPSIDHHVRRQLSTDISQSQKVYEDILQKIKLKNPSYSTVMNVSPPSLNEIQSKIDDKTALLEYWVANDAIVLFIIKRDQIVSKLIDFPKATLQRYVTAARNAISLQEAETTQRAMSELYKVLIAPAETEISGMSNLVIIPHRSLHFLPFHAMQDGKQFLVQKFVMSYAPSSSIFYHCMNRTVPHGDKFLGMALGDLKLGNYDPLPGTDLEVKELGKLYAQFTQKRAADFLESSFKLDAANYNYIHIATHGVFNKLQPLYSYLLMKDSNTDDGQVTVDEIFGLQINSKVVTLSACETGLGELGEGDDLVGLSRAFIYAGSPGVIVSLWKVDDETTAWLMTRFHQYLRGGNTVAESLTFAQRDLLNQKTVTGTARGMMELTVDARVQAAVRSKGSEIVQNPYYWAPFVLIGNGWVK